MKRLIVLALVAASCSFLVVVLWKSPHSKESSGSAVQATKAQSPSQTTATQAIASSITTSVAVNSFPSRLERMQLSDTERLRRLQLLGRVPPDADEEDWELAGLTSWWGNPLDAKAFWNGRVIWCDGSAMSEAAIRGRAWPPIPYDEATLKRLYPELVRAYPTDGETSWSRPALEGPAVRRGAVMTSRESAFWTVFIRRHPKPPENLERIQLLTAERILGLQKRHLDRTSPARLPPGEIARVSESLRQQEVEQRGYPPEMFSDDALLWAYVLKQREQFQKLADAQPEPDSVPIQAFWARLLVDPKSITEPLTDEQLRVANAWKFAYLQRLRREKVDESYINAYLKAWNLTPAEVFPENQTP